MKHFETLSHKTLVQCDPRASVKYSESQSGRQHDDKITQTLNTLRLHDSELFDQVHSSYPQKQ